MRTTATIWKTSTVELDSAQGLTLRSALAIVTGTIFAAMSALFFLFTYVGSSHEFVPGSHATLWLGTIAAVLVCVAVVAAVVISPFRTSREHAARLLEAYQSLESGTLESLAALNATIEAKDRYTAGHGLRVTLICMLIAQELKLDEREVDTLRRAATFHDIGKIAVPDDILRSDKKLTHEEFAMVMIHPVESAKICSKLAVLRDAIPTIRHHHERLDGGGYPDGIRGDDIPIGSRIIAVADTWDAITSDRPYRKGQPAVVALREIQRCTGSQFDPMVVDAFLAILSRDPWMFGLTPQDLEQQEEIEAVEESHADEPAAEVATLFRQEDDELDVAA